MHAGREIEWGISFLSPSPLARKLKPYVFLRLPSCQGGAGTWSDGKLTTRIGKNSRDVRDVSVHLENVCQKALTRVLCLTE